MDPKHSHHQADSQPQASTHSTLARPSGLPRPTSRLPLPRSSIPQLRQQPSLTSVSRPTNASASRNKVAVAALASKGARPPLSSTQSSDNRGPAYLRSTSSASHTTQDGAFKKPTTRPLSRANLQEKQRQASTSSSKASTTQEDDLGSTRSYQSENTCSTAATSPGTTPATPTFKKAPRPSLSERTIESLAQIPPSPASLRRKSSFFSPDSPMQPRSRPASSMDQRSRPTTRDSTMPPPAFATPRAMGNKPSLPNLSASVRGTTPSRFPNGNSAKTIRARSPTKASLLKSVEKENTITPTIAKTFGRVPARGSKTVTGRVQQPRGSVADLFGGDIVKKPTPAPKLTPRPAVKKAAPVPVIAKDESTPSPKAATAAKSSLALREQIRAAKAARLSSGKQDAAPNTIPDFDASQFKDPFNTAPKDERSLIRQRIDTARSDGRLNISAMALKDIPEEVLRMYDYDVNKDTDVQWNEVVDLTRFIAADNEIETIPDAVFPDMDRESYIEDEDVATPKFGGLEMLDLHGNNLFDVPMGLRKLECLTSLNLSRNRLMNDALETISQISSLRELKIADNLLTGELTFIECLTSLEVLDVSGNKLSSLPDEIRQLVRLRSLNVANNQLTDLPMNELSCMPLVEILASKNKLSGALFNAPGTRMDRLITLDISINNFSTLYTGAASPEFPALRTLNISFNAMASLPDLTAWTSLTTLLAEDNKLTTLPEGFVESTSLRTVDLTGNDLSKLDERIALMEGLEGFKVAANPLRERKFLTMGTAELKRELGARLGPVGFVE